MHYTVDTTSTDSTLRPARLALASNLAAYVWRHGMSQAKRWMSWPMDTEQTVQQCNNSLQAHINGIGGMHRPREGHAPAHSLFSEGNAPSQPPSPQHVSRRNQHHGLGLKWKQCWAVGAKRRKHA